MALRLECEDKYRLWAALVQGAVDRLFIPTETPPPLGAVVPVLLKLPGQPVLNPIQGTVVGRRRRGERFPGGVYLHFSHEELDACRGALGLASGQERLPRGRQAPRVYRRLALRFSEPHVDSPCAAQNLSETGLLAACPFALFAGQRVEVSLTLDDGDTVPLRAEVVWVKPAEELAGLRFVDLRPSIREKLAAAIQRMLQAAPRRAGRSVVVAEPNAGGPTPLRDALDRSRAEVFSASTGEEVLALARRQRPALVVLDVLLPGLDALDVCRRLEADVELSDIPVVFHSALEPTRLHALADEAGAADYLARPAEPEALDRMLRVYLRNTGADVPPGPGR